jgi:hypothetical protein
MAGLVGGGGSGAGYDYVQAAEPAGPDLYEKWLNTGTSPPTEEIWSGSEWVTTTTDDHTELGSVFQDQHHGAGAGLNLSNASMDVLTGNAVEIDGSNQVAVTESDINHDNISGVSASDHHNPVTVSNPLTEDGSQGLGLSLGAALGLETGALAVLDGLGLNADADSLDVLTGNAVEIDGSNQVAVTESDINHDNISGVSEGDHRTTERVEDIVAGLVSGAGNVSVSYDDAGDVLTVDTSALNTEEVEDAVASLISGGTGVTVSYDDGTGTLTIDGHSRYTDSEARSAVDGSSLSSLNIENATTTGRQAGARRPLVDSDEDNKIWTILTGQFTEIKYDAMDAGFDRDMTLHYQDGSTQPFTAAGNSTGWVSCDPSKVTIGTTGANDVHISGVNMVIPH